MEEQILKIVNHIGHAGTIAGVALAVALVFFALAFRAKRILLGSVMTGLILGLGFVPLAASAYLKSRGVYRVQVVVLRPDQTPVEIAQVKSFSGGELKMVGGGWELEIPPQNRPADGRVSLSAAAKDEFLKGGTMIVLGQDYYPTATIQTIAETSAKIRGVVVNEDLSVIAGAKVSIDGYPDVAVTDAKGNFVLPAHAGKGQMVEVRAQKDEWSGRLTAPAGKVVEVILSRE
jgi:hypothetical protein